MLKKKYSDEIDLIDLVLVLWKQKLKIILIISFFIFLLFVNQTIENSSTKVINVSVTLKPISDLEELEYSLLNVISFKKHLNKIDNLVSNSNKKTEADEKISLKLDERNYFLSQKQNFFKDSAINEFVTLDKFVNINKMFLFKLFLEKIENKNLLKKAVKEFNFLKEEDYKNIQEYEKSILNIVNSINVTGDGLDIQNKKTATNWKINYSYHDDLENWEEFLIFLEKFINKEVNNVLVNYLIKYFENHNKIIHYEIKNTEIEEKKKLLNKQLDLDVSDYIYGIAPVLKANLFYAAKIDYENKNYINERNLSKKSFVIQYFVAVIIGLLFSIIYIILETAVKRRL
jgi:hypothetical protein